MGEDSKASTGQTTRVKNIAFDMVCRTADVRADRVESLQGYVPLEVLDALDLFEMVVSSECRFSAIIIERYL